MSVSKWAYEPTICDGGYCCGECDLCSPQKIDKILEYRETKPVPREFYEKVVANLCKRIGELEQENAFLKGMCRFYKGGFDDEGQMR